MIFQSKKSAEGVFNFLCLIMDEHLNWKSRVEKIQINAPKP